MGWRPGLVRRDLRGRPKLGRDPETGNKRFHSEAVRGTKAQVQRRLTELLRQ